MWPDSYELALTEWAELRTNASEQDLETALHSIQNWWHQAPLVPHYLHVSDYNEWPLPWDLLADNTFCDLAIPLGIAYTLILCRGDIKQMIIAQTDQDTFLLINDEYVLSSLRDNIHADLNREDVNSKIDCDYFRKKLDK